MHVSRLIAVAVSILAIWAGPASANDRCRLNPDDMRSAQSIVEWSETQYSLTRNAAMILAWDRFGYEALEAEFDRYRETLGAGRWANLKSWRGCLRAYSSDETVCGLQSSRDNESRFLEGRSPKRGFPSTPPQASVAFATSMIGDCFGEKSAGLPIAPTQRFATVRETDGFAPGPFPTLACDYAAHRAEATKGEYSAVRDGNIWHRWNWAKDYRNVEQADGRSCTMMPRFAAMEIERNDPQWVSFRQEQAAEAAAEQAAEREEIRVAERNASLAELRAFGEQQRARLSEAQLYADLGPLPGLSGPVRNFNPDDPSFSSLLAELDRFDRIYTPTDVTELQNAAARGCAQCALLLANVYEHGLFGQDPNIPRAIRYALLNYSLSMRPRNGIVRYGNGGRAKATRLITGAPEGRLGIFTPILRAMRGNRDIPRTNQMAQAAHVSDAIFDAMPIIHIDEGARRLNPQTMTMDDLQSLQGVGAVRTLAARLIRSSDANRRLSDVQESILLSAAESGDADAAQWHANNAVLTGGNQTEVIYRYEVAAAINSDDPQPFTDLAIVLLRRGDAYAAADYAARAERRGSSTGASVRRQAEALLDSQARARRAQEESRRRAQESQVAPYTLSDGFRDLGNAIQQDTQDYLDCMDRAERTGGYCVRR